MNPNIPTPSIDEVNKYLTLWQTLENYRLQENALNKLFIELAPNNTDISDVLIKSATLNDFYSTNIFTIYPVAKHIMQVKNIDERLKNGDVTLIDDIKTITINGKTKHFYSFTSKYCSHHNSNDFPIYDSYVEKVLLYLNKTHRFSDFNQANLKDYAKFKSVLLDFQAFFKLDDYNLKQIDQYLWLLGKEFFPKYKNAK
ncbi:MAG: hypothetical protein Q3971_05195 [Moraxella sp.]|nr:hypothetical protein [Moraxella sp.]